MKKHISKSAQESFSLLFNTLWVSVLFGRLGLQFFDFSICVSSQFSLLGQGSEFKRILQISADLGTILQIRALKGPFVENRSKIPRYCSDWLDFNKIEENFVDVDLPESQHRVSRVSFPRSLRENPLLLKQLLQGLNSVLDLHASQYSPQGSSEKRVMIHIIHIKLVLHIFEYIGI